MKSFVALDFTMFRLPPGFNRSVFSKSFFKLSMIDECKFCEDLFNLLDTRNNGGGETQPEAWFFINLLKLNAILVGTQSRGCALYSFPEGFEFK